MGQKHTRWAMVGLGRQAQRLASAMAQVRGNELATILSKNTKHAADFAVHYGGTRQTSLHTLLADSQIDAVCIASPNHEHAKQVIAAAHAGKDILCEKPLALTVAEGRAIQAAVRKSGVRCAVNFQLRMHPAIQHTRALIAQKKLGKLLHVEMQWSIGSFKEQSLPPLPRHMQWREKPGQAGGGAIMARGVHLFDLLRFLSGKEVREIYAYTDATAKTVDRTAIGIATLEEHISATVMTSKIMPGADNRIVIYGTHGHITLRNCFDSGEKASLEIKTARGTKTTQYAPVDLLAETFKAFNKKGKTSPLAAISDGIATIAIAEAYTTSAKSKRAVAVPR